MASRGEGRRLGDFVNVTNFAQTLPKGLFEATIPIIMVLRFSMVFICAIEKHMHDLLKIWPRCQNRLDSCNECSTRSAPGTFQLTENDKVFIALKTECFVDRSTTLKGTLQ